MGRVLDLGDRRVANLHQFRLEALTLVAVDHSSIVQPLEERPQGRWSPRRDEVVEPCRYDLNGCRGVQHGPAPLASEAAERESRRRRCSRSGTSPRPAALSAV